MAEAPIVINPSVLPDVVKTIIRWVAGPLGGFLIGRGWISADQAMQLPGLIMALVAGGWALYSTVSKKQTLIAIAGDPRVPDSVASVSVR